MWLAAWKLVSNDAKRTVAPPNAKHSTLFQGCFFMFLFFIPFTIRQQSIIYPHIFFTDPGDVCVVVWKNGRHFRLGEMPPLLIFNPDFGDCQLAGVLVILPPLLLCR